MGRKPQVVHLAISIHALLTESDLPGLIFRKCDGRISIHALLTESDVHTLRNFTVFPISIHALLTESDDVNFAGKFILHSFQSTLSSRRATSFQSDVRTRKQISIHALLTESDRCMGTRLNHRIDFNPRSPHGERLAV